MTFSKALEIVKDGGLIAREVWDSSDAFVFKRPSDQIVVGNIIENVKSLPDSFKQKLENAGLSDNYGIDFTAYLCLCHPPTKSVQNGWSPTQEDMLAEDWKEVV